VTTKLNFNVTIFLYTSLFARKAAATSEKKHQTHNSKNKQTKERKNYAQIGRASEQCYHIWTSNRNVKASMPRPGLKLLASASKFNSILLWNLVSLAFGICCTHTNSYLLVRLKYIIESL